MSRAPRPSWTHLPPVDDPPTTIFDALCLRFPGVDRATWRRRFDRDLVIDEKGRPLRADRPYAAHLRIGYFREVEAEPETSHDFGIVHVDEHVIVADKPPFLPVVPGGRFVRRCLLYQLEERLGLEHCAPAHRLDRVTSGLVLFVRRREERAAYCELFARGEIERVYEAYVRTTPEYDGRSFDVANRLEPSQPFFLMREASGEPNAFTRIEWIERRGEIARFVLRPSSGKKHQLRIHMASVGLPILGDDFYPVLRPEGPDDVENPLRLTATELAFRDPITGKDRHFFSKISFRSELFGNP